MYGLYPKPDISHAIKNTGLELSRIVQEVCMDGHEDHGIAEDSGLNSKKWVGIETHHKNSGERYSGVGGGSARRTHDGHG